MKLILDGYADLMLRFIILIIIFFPSGQYPIVQMPNFKDATIRRPYCNCYFSFMQIHSIPTINCREFRIQRECSIQELCSSRIAIFSRYCILSNGTQHRALSSYELLLFLKISQFDPMVVISYYMYNIFKFSSIDKSHKYVFYSFMFS